MSSRNSFFEAVTAAVNDILEHGFDSQERVTRWLERLQNAARASLVPEAVMINTLKAALAQKFRSATSTSRLMKVHPGVSQFTLAHIKPKLHAELQRRIAASAQLIKLNRNATIEKTLQRFQGWASGVPAGGSDAQSRREVKDTVRRGLAGLSFEERRVNIDQGTKLVAAINDIVATDGGAIALIWRHIHGGPHYQSRPEHVARDGKIFVIRDNWAMKRGLMRLDGRQYYDQVTAVGEEVYCSCYANYIYNLSALPSEMLTAAGKLALAEARKAISAA